MTIKELGIKAKIAERFMRGVTTVEKNDALFAIKNALQNNASKILDANAIDLRNARENGISEAMQDRLRLTNDRITAISNAVSQLINLPDPIGEVVGGNTRPNGMRITKIRVPMGVIGIIFESRPNVTVDAAALCLKSGNVTILRGGKEAINSNVALVGVMRDAVKNILNPDVIQIVMDTSHETATELMKANEYLDLLIPRGGAGLINAVVRNATVPVIETGTGNCHIFVDEFADLEMALSIIKNAKTSRPSVCNATETVLIHEKIAKNFLPRLKDFIQNVELRGCEETQKIIDCNPASEEDFYKEFLDLILAVQVVPNIDSAINHIEKYGTKHSECIVTGCLDNADKFQRLVDSSAIYVNASTRFTDGEEFGFGAEIGISTQKLHARGPMGLAELTTIKYLINGNGNIR